MEMVNNGVDMNKIVVGKPVGPAGYASNGYVDPKELMFILETVLLRLVRIF